MIWWKPRYRGSFDGVFGKSARGWIFSPRAPREKFVVEIVDEGRVVTSSVADKFRVDLLNAGIGDGFCGFVIELPDSLFDGNKRFITARLQKNKVVVPGGTKAINAPLPQISEVFNFDYSDISQKEIVPAILHRLAAIEASIAHQNVLLEGIVNGRKSGHKTSSTLSTSPKGINFGGERNPKGNFYDLCNQSPGESGDIFLFSIIDWGFRTQRPQHLCENLGARGFRIFYVSVHLDQRLSADCSSFEVISNPAPNVYEVKLRVSGPIPSVYSGISDPEQLRELCIGVGELQRDLSIASPIAILQFPAWFQVARSMDGAVIVYDCLDHIAGFSNVSPEVIATEEKLIDDADIVVTTSEYLREKISEQRENLLIRNGCEYSFFSIRPLELVGFGKKPIVGYYGAISEWFDGKLVSELASRNPGWHFVLIGSTEGFDSADLESFENISFLGEKPYRDLTKYLYSFDVCIVPFKKTELIKSTNPVKVYEYLAAGKPVVCTAMPEVKLMPSNLVRIGTTVDEFEAAISNSLAEREDAELIELRKSWAQENSWNARAEVYAEALKSHFPKISVVMLSYNGLTFTKACLASVEKFSGYPNMEVICVDNNSTDGTREFLEEWREGGQKRKIILNDENLGFSGGNNIGIKAADGDFVILLNNDTFVTNGWVHDLIRPMMRDPTIGLAGPITNMIGGIQKIRIAYSNMTEMAERARKFTIGRKQDIFEAENLAFFCVAISREVIASVGLLDVAYGVGFFEDDDYCNRVRAAGYRLVCVDGVFIHHHLSASFNALGDNAKAELFKKNKAVYEAKWGEWRPHEYRNQAGFGD